MAHCCVTGCRREAARHSSACLTHIINRRRWGHYTQPPLKKGEVTQSRKHVRKLLVSRPNAGSLWEKLRVALVTMKDDTRATRREAENGKTFVGLPYHVAGLLQTIFEETSEEDIILTAVGIGYLSAHDPRRFKTDDAFFASMGRRMLMLARSRYEGHISKVNGTRHWVFRETKPKHALEVGRMFARTFGAFGMKLHEIEGAEAKAKANAFSAPLLALKAEPQVSQEC